MKQPKSIHIYADWAGLDGPQQIGGARIDNVRGKEVMSFSYDPVWLKRGEPVLLDPKLYFSSGPQYAESAFGLFLDSAPDRWGRILIQRREALRARAEGRGERTFSDSDYLLEVHDAGRMGAIRFKTDPDGPFCCDDGDLAAPPLTALRNLEQAARQIEAAQPDDPASRQWLTLLLAPGTSLGGARPKANVMDTAGNLWIAKFPRQSDETDIGRWEAVVYHLAKDAGLETANARKEQFSKFGHTFMVRRFDRMGQQRIHFASALNLLGYQDGAGAKTGVSYLDLVDLIVRISEDADSDLEQLWMRIAFSVCVSNTDDHLRNHGFLLRNQGWRLSPVYDLNPQPWGDGLALNISETSNALNLDLVREVAPFFRLSPNARDTRLRQIILAVTEWQKVARAHGVTQSEIDRMRPAFRTDS